MRPFLLLVPINRSPCHTELIPGLSSAPELHSPAHEEHLLLDSTAMSACTPPHLCSACRSVVCFVPRRGAATTHASTSFAVCTHIAEEPRRIPTRSSPRLLLPSRHRHTEHRHHRQEDLSQRINKKTKVEDNH
jgi:hypothetical protein